MLDVLRHQDLEGVLATVVRYFGGVKLGAGGLVRAYTDCVAQALLTATKVPLQRMTHLQCLVPYALEGLLRREIDAAHAELLEVQHGQLVTLHLRLPAAQAAAFVQRINDQGQGRVGWQDAPGIAA
jgi:putative IMPACT (imprinted ancient) family translation regulator